MLNEEPNMLLYKKITEINNINNSKRINPRIKYNELKYCHSNIQKNGVVEEITMPPSEWERLYILPLIFVVNIDCIATCKGTV